MDNLTHSMVGAMLGQTGLKRKTGLGMAALVIGANIPDIDAACTFWGIQSFAMRRGLTHGPIAWLVLPVLLTALLIAWDRRQTRRGTRPEQRLPLRPGWLYVLALIGTLSHPAMDWLNNYGIRLLEPFSSRWFYGDTMFIIDLWLWMLLIGGYIWSRRAEKHGVGDWRRRGKVILTVASAYIAGNGIITGLAEARTADWLRSTARSPELVVANPVPLLPWRRVMLWRSEGYYGSRAYSLFDAQGGAAGADDAGQPTGMDDPAVSIARNRDADAHAFLFWSRMPVAQRRADGALVLSDQRFRGFESDRFKVVVPAERLR
jgi:inner membrane protein